VLQIGSSHSSFGVTRVGKATSIQEAEEADDDGAEETIVGREDTKGMEQLEEALDSAKTICECTRPDEHDNEKRNQMKRLRLQVIRSN
jgi:hypothetical protein